jgi:hypothetical protein
VELYAETYRCALIGYSWRSVHEHLVRIDVHGTINPPILLFGIITIATFGIKGLLDEVGNLVTGKNCWSTLMSSLER